jgi:hypothetical protein
VLVLLLVSGCHASIAGSWTGNLESPSRVALRVVLEHGGTVTGTTFWENLETHTLEYEGPISGKRTGSKPTLATSGEVSIIGEVSSDVFKAIVSFPADGDEPGHDVAVPLPQGSAKALCFVCLPPRMPPSRASTTSGSLVREPSASTAEHPGGP